MTNEQLKQKENIKISSEKFTAELIKNNIGPVVEVPCSYLKDFLNYLLDSKRMSVINPVNEAIAMGIASGEYLGSGKIPIVAMQNSGLMNTLNALTSLNQIYDIPVFMMITWRGGEGVGKDAPEHDITGRDLEKILKTFNLPYEVVDGLRFEEQIKDLSKIAEKTKKPVALIIKKDSFEKYSKKNIQEDDQFEMTRFDAISIVKKQAKAKAVFISSTGFPTRDSFAVEDTPDFYMVGSMGHTFATALGVSAHTEKKVIVLDGDGSMFMQLGSMASFDSEIHKNIIYIVLDNQSYESTGGQSTAFKDIDISKLAEIFKFKNIYRVNSKNDLEDAVKKAVVSDQSSFVQLSVRKGEGKLSTRITDVYTCSEIKDRFINGLDDQK